MSASAVLKEGTSIKSLPLYKMIRALTIIQDVTGNRELTALASTVLLHIATHDEMPIADLQGLCGCTHAAISRILAKLSQGLTPDAPGAKLIEYYEDPYYRARKLVKLSPKGKEMAKKLSKVLE